MCNYRKLKKLIRSMEFNKKVNALNFGYTINIGNKCEIIPCSVEKYDDFFNEFFKNNKKYLVVRSKVEQKIMNFAAKKAYELKTSSKVTSIRKEVLGKEMGSILDKINPQEHNCIFSIDGLLYKEKSDFKKNFGDCILITNEDITTKYLSEVKVNQDNFKKKSFVIRLTSQSYNYKDAVILSKKVADILANFLNILGIVKMNILTKVSIGYNDDWIYDVIDYDEANNITIGNSFPNRQILFDFDYVDDNICGTMTDILSKILKREKVTSFDETIILAISLIGSAITSEDNPYAYFKCVAALECFFEKQEDEGDIRQILFEKTNKLLSMHEKYDNYCLPGDFYDNRSTVAHGDILNVSDEELFIMKKISSIVLIVMLENYNRFNTDDFKNEINYYINEDKKSR